MQQSLDEMERTAFPVREGETFHMTVCYLAYYNELLGIAAIFSNYTSAHSF